GPANRSYKIVRRALSWRRHIGRIFRARIRGTAPEADAAGDESEGSRMARVRLKDVAERTGVTIRTVSNVVRGNCPVSEPTRSRVMSAIAELDYRPNASARHLRTGRSGVIVLAVPELVQPYFSELVSAVIDPAREHDLSVLIEDTGGYP